MAQLPGRHPAHAQPWIAPIDSRPHLNKRPWLRLTSNQVSLDEIRAHSREMADGILNQPFDFSQAFDRAVKNIVNTLGNRPAHETAEDTVSQLSLSTANLLTPPDVLLRLCRQFWRICLQPPDPQFRPPQPHGVARRNRHKMLPRTPKGCQECPLQREQAIFPLSRIQRSNHDHERRRQYKRLPHRRR